MAHHDHLTRIGLPRVLPRVLGAGGGPGGGGPGFAASFELRSRVRAHRAFNLGENRPVRRGVPPVHPWTLIIALITPRERRLLPRLLSRHGVDLALAK